MIHNCPTCKNLMTRTRVGDDKETICKVDGKVVSRVIDCSAWEKEAIEQREKK